MAEPRDSSRSIENTILPEQRELIERCAFYFCLFPEGNDLVAHYGASEVRIPLAQLRDLDESAMADHVDEALQPIKQRLESNVQEFVEALSQETDPNNLSTHLSRIQNRAETLLDNRDLIDDSRIRIQMFVIGMVIKATHLPGAVLKNHLLGMRRDLLEALELGVSTASKIEEGDQMEYSYPEYRNWCLEKLYDVVDEGRDLT